MAHAGNAAAGPAAPTDAREEAAAPVDEIVAGAGAETPGPSDGNAAETKDDSTNEKRGTGELEKRGVAEIHAPEGAVEAGAVAAAVTEPAVAEPAVAAPAAAAPAVAAPAAGYVMSCAPGILKPGN